VRDHGVDGRRLQSINFNAHDITQLGSLHYKKIKNSIIDGFFLDNFKNRLELNFY
jgi:hypothetical protein